MITLACIYNHCDSTTLPLFLKYPNVYVNICVAYPFFALGVFANIYKERINSNHSKTRLGFTFLSSLILVYVCGTYNDYVWMYRCGYGGNFLLFIIGGVAGTCCIYAISKITSHTPESIAIISKGTILILGFHRYILDWMRGNWAMSYLDFVFTVIILFLFVPLIVIAERYFPLIIGKYRIKKIQTGKPE